MLNDDNDDETTFEASISDTDYGLIVCGKTGLLKGLWTPLTIEDKPVPESIVNLCIDYFGVDPAEFEDDGMGDPLTDSIH